MCLRSTAQAATHTTWSQAVQGVAKSSVHHYLIEKKQRNKKKKKREKRQQKNLEKQMKKPALAAFSRPRSFLSNRHYDYNEEKGNINITFGKRRVDWALKKHVVKKHFFTL